MRVIYKYALDHIPKEQCQELYKQYTIHEKKYGDRQGIEDVIVSKRKHQYETVSWGWWGGPTGETLLVGTLLNVIRRFSFACVLECTFFL